MGHGLVGQMGHFFGWVTWVMGQCMLTHDPPLFHQPQQVTVKYRQKFTVNTHGSLWIMIFQHSVKAECYTSVLYAVLGLATGVK